MSRLLYRLPTDRLELAERLAPSFVRQCLQMLAPSLKQAVEQARDHISAVNLALLPKSWQKEIRPDTIVGEKFSPLGSVGIWIPARKGPLISTALCRAGGTVFVFDYSRSGAA